MDCTKNLELLKICKKNFKLFLNISKNNTIKNIDNSCFLCSKKKCTNIACYSKNDLLYCWSHAK